MKWAVGFHDLVLSRDCTSISRNDLQEIMSAVERKLGVDPQAYGKPLRGVFSGYWRLRVGKYRVIYEIIKHQVMVIVVKVGQRKDDLVYKEFVLRLKHLN